MRNVWLAGLVSVAAIAGFFGGRCSAIPPVMERPRSAALARHGGGVVAADDLRAYVEEGGPAQQEKARTVEGARSLVDELVARAVLANAARMKQIDREPAVVARAEQVLADAYRERVIESEVGALSVSDAEVAKAFEAERAQLSVPERVRVGIIRVSDKTDAAKVVAEAKKAMARSPDGFSDVARSRSQDAQTRPFGGQLPYFTREELAERVGASAAEAAFGLRGIGEMHPAAVEGPGGYYVIRLLGREDAQNPELEEVAPRLRQRLLKAKRDAVRAAHLERLRAEAKVEIDEAALRTFVDQSVANARRP